MENDRLRDEVMLAGREQTVAAAGAGRIEDPPTRHPLPMTALKGDDREFNRARYTMFVMPTLVLGFGLILVLRHFGLVSPEPLWPWAGVFGALAVLSTIAPSWVDQNPSRRELLPRVGGLAVLTTTAIYLTGWGPVLISALAINCVMTVVRYGPNAWKALVALDLSCVLLGQIGISLHLVPTELPAAKAEGLAAMGVLLYLVIVRLTVYAAGEIKAAEERLEFAAFHDTLTGLANRALILDRAEQLLARSRRQDHEPAVLFVDLDNFKDVNDTLGHEAGDFMLIQFANCLTATVRKSDTVGRMGGDEFVVLLEGPLTDVETERIAADLLVILHDVVIFGPGYEHPIRVSASIGIAVGRRETPGALIRDADIALYQAKRAGKRRSVVFTETMAQVASERLQHESDLHRAVEEGEFFLVYQPLFDLEPVAVYGVEALLRWQHPVRGIVSPDEFIPALEENGLILEVGRWVLDEACRQLAAWEREGHDLVMSINVSMAQFETDRIVADVREAISAAGCKPADVVIEITESMLMSDPKAVLDRLRALKDLGVRIAVDDFGTGYSSLAYLAEFPVDELKIDRTFVSSIFESRESNVIVKSFVDLGQALGIGTLAEGIEDHTQLEMLQSARCLRGQGFLVSRPLAAEALVEFLREWRPTSGQDESQSAPAIVSGQPGGEVRLSQ